MYKTMKQNYLILLIAFSTATLLISCNKENSNKSVTSDTASATVHTGTPDQVYTVKAVVTEVDEGKNRIFIDHEKMEGFMEAMVMPFKVKDPTVFTKVKPGTKGTFTIEVTDGIGIIADVNVESQ